jgi:hypothetical protein
MRSKSYLGAYLRRQRSRLGAPKPITATAHKLARNLFIKLILSTVSPPALEDSYRATRRSRTCTGPWGKFPTCHRRAQELAPGKFGRRDNDSGLSSITRQPSPKFLGQRTSQLGLACLTRSGARSRRRPSRTLGWLGHPQRWRNRRSSRPSPPPPRRGPGASGCRRRGRDPSRSGTRTR